ncbi:ABC transporter ATP-binding protein [Sporomusa sphaeroides]|uniref:Daunorubicin/doxorubicin resistance ATP-binding protein DrrA n=1 Tax=Sporomusa sphaeroides DSM 2875 TaxID=1337886 RepID=A0ABM9VZK9_9FIRM|nr:ABC transporter ATP-binding protein [Sporomusa sphaeroides]OLS57130.1 daunorubicin/doxorubicin resistance ATP-binding protein DrrA [Sporomusa sphaeroides DSM 2875]CVK18316.1 Daunorubicin/doxorubicin resistance ATP-binding protein DrrA [Sporomusa sphaeroides DSM 2875]HML31778.1 ABC transporter ATP-binding protein [Sporomusa sphaeroides]
MIHIANLVKRFGSRTAVDGVSLDISQGEIFGLLGPNGAGKTTMIRMLTMLTRPTAGTLSIQGWQLPQDEQKVKPVIGIVSQHFNLDADLTVRENLELHGRLQHIPLPQRARRIPELLEYVELTERANDKVQALSGGMKRRLMIARALLHEPKVLFLDEPTVGLDPQVRRRLWDLIRRMAHDKLTVMLTTHYIEEAEFLCGRVAILEKGSMIALDSPAALCERLGVYVVEWSMDEGRQTKFFHSREEAAAFAGTLTMTTTIRRSNLEDVFVELTGRKVVD